MEKNKNTNERNIIFAIIVVLIIGTVIFALLNINSFTNFGDSKVDGTILFKYGEELKYVDFEFIEKLPQTEFEATVRSSGQKPVDVIYTAVKLADILDSLKIDYSEISRAIVRAEDAYASSVTSEDIAVDDNVYIAYKIDGKYMNAKEDGGQGPFQLVIRQDNFSQRWVKYVVEVELQ